MAGDRVRLGSKQSAAPGNTNRPSQGLGTALVNHDTVAESGSGHSPPAKSVIGRPSAPASAWQLRSLRFDARGAMDSVSTHSSNDLSR